MLKVLHFALPILQYAISCTRSILHVKQFNPFVSFICCFGALCFLLSHEIFFFRHLTFWMWKIATIVSKIFYFLIRALDRKLSIHEWKRSTYLMFLTNDGKCLNIASKDCSQLKHIWKTFSHTIYWELRTCGICESCKWTYILLKRMIQTINIQMWICL